jgi:hypothetical protein
LLWVANWPEFPKKMNPVKNTQIQAKILNIPSASWVCWLELSPELYSSLLSSSYCTCFNLPSKN